MFSTYFRKVSSSSVREVNDLDATRICCQLYKAKERAKDKPVVRDLDVELAVSKIVRQTDCKGLVIHEGILLVYDVGYPWYSYSKILQELLVLRIGTGGTFRDVCDVLDDLANEHDVAAINVGGALAASERALVRMYKAAGYETDQSPGLIKWR